MPVLHFLNVNDGDCSIIEHISGRITVIDVCNAREVTPVSEFVEKISKAAAMEESGVSGNFNQKKYPVNPISYMRDRDLNSVFRLILTIPTWIIWTE
jgi:competence protein ComEC